MLSGAQIVIECKVLHGSLERTIREGLEPTRAYMDRCGAVEGHLDAERHARHPRLGDVIVLDLRRPSKREVIRCLKRYVAREIYQLSWPTSAARLTRS